MSSSRVFTGAFRTHTGGAFDTVAPGEAPSDAAAMARGAGGRDAAKAIGKACSEWLWEAALAHLQS